jgi:hypothetical protein
VVAVLTGSEIIREGGSEFDSLVSAKLKAVRSALPASVVDVVAVALNSDPPSGVSDRLLIGLAPLLERAERVAMIRRMQEASARSKAFRIAGQIGKQGKKLFNGLLTPRNHR